MATVINQYNPNFTNGGSSTASTWNNTFWRNWVSGTIAGITAGGIVQTSDTGQINTATTTFPAYTGAAGLTSGYAIFHLADALQSTNPVFFKLEFGNCPGSSWYFGGLYLTVGTGSDGAGNITGITVPRTVSTYAPNQGGYGLNSITNQLYNQYIQSGPDGFVLNHDTGIMICVERSQSTVPDVVVLFAQPTYNTTNVVWTSVSLNGTFLYSSYNGTSGYMISPYYFPYANNGAVQPITLGSNVSIIPAIMQAGQVLAFKRIVYFNTTALPLSTGGTFGATIFGTTHTYIVPAWRPMNQVVSPTNDTLAILWE